MNWGAFFLKGFLALGVGHFWCKNIHRDSNGQRSKCTGHYWAWYDARLVFIRHSRIVMFNYSGFLGWTISP